MAIEALQSASPRSNCPKSLYAQQRPSNASTRSTLEPKPLPFITAVQPTKRSLGSEDWHCRSASLGERSWADAPRALLTRALLSDCDRNPVTAQTTKRNAIRRWLHKILILPSGLWIEPLRKFPWKIPHHATGTRTRIPCDFPDLFPDGLGISPLC